MTRGAGNMCGGHIEEADPWPTCNVHYNLVTNYDEFYSWSWASMGGAHGPIHFWLGGFLDCEQPYDRMTDLVGSTMARAFRKKAFDHRKGLYWDGIWYCEGSVNADISPEEVSMSRVLGAPWFIACRRQEIEAGFRVMTPRVHAMTLLWSISGVKVSPSCISLSCLPW